MPDREKVINAIECRKNAHKRCGNPCEQTGACAYAAWIRDADGEPYYPCYCDVERLCNDALALLREQEPAKREFGYGVKPEFRRGIPSCGRCGNVLANHYRNCPWCGCEVNWDGQ